MRAEVWPGSGLWDIWVPQWASRHMRNKAQKERNEGRGMVVNEDGTIATVNILKACSQAHLNSVEEGNTLWKKGEAVEVIFSADAIQTGRGMKHNVAGVRSLSLEYGTTSAYNFIPITTSMTGELD